MKIAIAIFVKTPGVSPLKTRLAATVGKERAECFYQLSLNCIASTLKKLEVHPFWAIAEKECLNHPLWTDFNRMHTGEGGLGDLQNHVYHELLETHEGVILIGGDAPQLSEEIVGHAMTALKTYDFAIGPATDGGYYLLAGRKQIPHEIWSSTPWSDPKTRETLVSQMLAQLGSEPVELTTLTDVDTEADLKQMLIEMPSNMNDHQQALKDWFNQL